LGAVSGTACSSRNLVSLVSGHRQFEDLDGVVWAEGLSVSLQAGCECFGSSSVSIFLDGDPNAATNFGQLGFMCNGVTSTNFAKRSDGQSSFLHRSSSLLS
jgi:hypothetical protein